MKKIIGFIFMASISCVALADQKDIVGKINAISYGEFDPDIIGDACIVQLKLLDNSFVGLVTDYEDCENNITDFSKGRGVSVAKETVKVIKSKKEIEILEDVFPETRFYSVPAGTIENGLAD